MAQLTQVAKVERVVMMSTLASRAWFPICLLIFFPQAADTTKFNPQENLIYNSKTGHRNRQNRSKNTILYRHTGKSNLTKSWIQKKTNNKLFLPFCQPGILCGGSGRLEQSTTEHSFGTYIIDVQNHAQDTSFLLQWLTVSRVCAANIVRRPCSDSSHVTAPYTSSFY